MDKIHIKGLEIFARHGVYPEENVLGQKFLISACLYTDTRKAGLTDCLESSINYGDVCRKMTDFMTEHTFSLLERAAELLARDLLLAYPLLQKSIWRFKSPGPR